jgi:hypothetical protein
MECRFLFFQYIVIVFKSASTYTVFPAPRTTPFWLKKVEYCSAESKMLHMRHICTFLFFCYKCASSEAYLSYLGPIKLSWVKWELSSVPAIQCSVGDFIVVFVQPCRLHFEIIQCHSPPPPLEILIIFGESPRIERWPCHLSHTRYLYTV